MDSRYSRSLGPTTLPTLSILSDRKRCGEAPLVNFAPRVKERSLRQAPSRRLYCRRRDASARGFLAIAYLPRRRESTRVHSKFGMVSQGLCEQNFAAILHAYPKYQFTKTLTTIARQTLSPSLSRAKHRIRFAAKKRTLYLQNFGSR